MLLAAFRGLYAITQNILILKAHSLREKLIKVVATTTSTILSYQWDNIMTVHKVFKNV